MLFQKLLINALSSIGLSKYSNDAHLEIFLKGFNEDFIKVNQMMSYTECRLHVFFYKQHFYKQCQAEIGKKLSKF